jgi:hypothetical protein
MAERIMCDPHDLKGKPVYGMRISVSVRIEHNDKPAEEISGTYDLCEPDARPLLASIEYMRQMNLASQVDGAPPGPPKLPKEKKPASPREANPEPSGQQDTFTCGLCVKRVHYRRRGHHAIAEHGIRAWQIKWLPLFDTAGWLVCGGAEAEECGYVIATHNGMNQHEKATGHERRPAVLPVDEDEPETETGRALARAVNNQQ